MRFSVRITLAAVAVATAAMIGPSLASAASYAYPSLACPQSSTGLTDCIAGASTGDTISVKPGTYYENVVASNGVIVTGGKGCKTPPVFDAGNNFVAVDVEADGVTLECLKFQNAPGWNGIDNSNGHDQLHLKSVQVTNFYNGVWDGGGSDGLQVTNSEIQTMAGSGIRADGPDTNVVVTGTTVRFVGEFCAIFNGVDTSTFTGNKFGPCLDTGLYLQGGTNNAVARNTVTTTNQYGYLIQSQLTSIEKNVSDGSGNVAFQSEANGNSLVDNRVKGAPNSDAFYVTGQDVVITGNVDPAGAGGYFIVCSCDNATISGNSVTGRVSADAINASGPNMTISKNTITGGGHGQGIYVSGDTPIVTKNTVSGGWGSSGIYFDCTGACMNAQLTQNTESGSYDDFGIQVYNAGCAAPGCTQVKGNTANKNQQAGFHVQTNWAAFSGNMSKHSGFGASGCSSGFDIGGSNNSFAGNTATSNACDGFVARGGNNVFSGNAAKQNGQMGFHNQGSANTYDKNTASHNTGDGFNNDGTGANYTKNTASQNHQDCTSDSGEGATLGTVTGNACADGTNFAVDSTLSDYD